MVYPEEQLTIEPIDEIFYLKDVATTLIQLPLVEALYVSKLGLWRAKEIWLAVQVHNPTEIPRAVCDQIGQVVIDDTIYPFEYSLEDKFVVRAGEITLYHEHDQELETGLDLLCNFDTMYPCENPFVKMFREYQNR